MRAFVNSLPKSGTHLVLKALRMLGFADSGVSISTMSLLGSFRIVRSLLRGPWWPGARDISIGLDMDLAARRGWVEKAVSRIGCGEFGFGHLPYSTDLHEILERDGLSILMAIRDPRAVLVSWAHYVSSTPGHYCYDLCRDWSLARTVEWLVEGGRTDGIRIIPFGEILGRAAGWVSEEDVAVFRFEDLVGPKGGGSAEIQRRTMKSLASAVGLPRTDAELADLCGRLFGGTKTFRRGDSEAWKEELPETLKSTLDERLANYLLQWGYADRVE